MRDRSQFLAFTDLHQRDERCGLDAVIEIDLVSDASSLVDPPDVFR